MVQPAQRPQVKQFLEARKDSVATTVTNEVNRELEEAAAELKALKEINCDFSLMIGQQAEPLKEAAKVSAVAQAKIAEADLSLERSEQLQNAARKQSAWMVPALGTAGLVVGCAGFAISIPVGLVAMGVLGIAGASGGAIAAFKN
jgi:hypothetical protein